MPASTGSALAEQLAGSQSTTIYVGGEYSDDDVTNLLITEPHLWLEFDEVRQLWAVSLASEQQVAEATPAEEAEASY
jgi:hypothetical protein